MASKNFKTIKLDPKYIPKKTEKYMCDDQRAYFYNLLSGMREELLSDTDEVLNAIKTVAKLDSSGTGDEADTSSFEQDANMQIRMNQRNSNMLKQIDAALARLDAGTYGYSIVSGEEIGLKRLMARPLATMTIKEREEYEQKKK